MRMLALLFLIMLTNNAIGASKPEDIQSQIDSINESLKVTQTKAKSTKDVDYLPEIFLSIADLQIRKSQLMIDLKQAENPNVDPTELDFTAANRARAKAITTYMEIIERFKKYPQYDKVLFLLGLELKFNNQPKKAMEILRRITTEFPDSKYWAQAKIEIALHFFDLNDFEFAIKHFEEIVAKKDKNATGFAYYKIMQSYTKMGDKWEEAVRAGERGALWFRKALQKKSNIDKKFEVSEQLAVELIYPYGELSAKEVKKSKVRKDIVKYFKLLTTNSIAYNRAMKALGRRLSIKKRYAESLIAYTEALAHSHNLDFQLSTLESLYNTIKEGKLLFTNPRLNHLIFRTMNTVKNRSLTEPKRKDDLLKYEPVVRDYLTSVQDRLQTTKRTEGLKALIKGYENYLWLYEGGKHFNAMKENLASALMLDEDYVNAGIVFLSLAKKSTGKAAYTYNKKSLQNFALALENSSDLKNLEKIQSRMNYRNLGDQFIKKYPKDKMRTDIEYNLAKTYYDARDFVETQKRFNTFLGQCRHEKLCDNAALLVVDSFLQQREFKKLGQYSKGLLKRKNLSSSTKQKIQDAVANSRLDEALQVSNDGQDEDAYANELLKLAQEDSKGLAETALYEAFITLKNANNPKLFNIGKAYILRFPKSDKAQSILTLLLKSGVTSMNYKAVADAISIMILKNPGISDAAAFAKQAEFLYRKSGHFGRAQKMARFSRDQRALIELAMLEKNTNELKKTGAKTPGISGLFAQGMGYFLEKNYDFAQSIFNQGIAAGNVSPDETEHAARLAYYNALISYRNFLNVRPKQFSKELLAAKISAYDEIDRHLISALDKGVATEVVSSLYLLSQAQREMVQFLQRLSKSQPQQSPVRALLTSKAKEYMRDHQVSLKKCLQIAQGQHIVQLTSLACKNQSDLSFAEMAQVDNIQYGQLTTTDTQLVLKLLKKPGDSKALAELYSDFTKKKYTAWPRPQRRESPS
ncbi:MAG: tetratricopeptide repeat protein [Bdellovibrionales bacterium]